MKPCDLCGSPVVTETSTFRDHACGSTWEEGTGVDQSQKCLRRKLEQDLTVDDEINRRRERRHFEPDHFGT